MQACQQARHKTGQCRCKVPHCTSTPGSRPKDYGRDNKAWSYEVNQGSLERECTEMPTRKGQHAR